MSENCTVGCYWQNFDATQCNHSRSAPGPEKIWTDTESVSLSQRWVKGLGVDTLTPSALLNNKVLFSHSDWYFGVKKWDLLWQKKIYKAKMTLSYCQYKIITSQVRVGMSNSFLCRGPHAVFVNSNKMFFLLFLLGTHCGQHTSHTHTEMSIVYISEKAGNFFYHLPLILSIILFYQLHKCNMNCPG